MNMQIYYIELRGYRSVTMPGDRPFWDLLAVEPMDIDAWITQPPVNHPRLNCEAINRGLGNQIPNEGLH